jgi:CBS domain-containing protein
MKVKEVMPQGVTWVCPTTSVAQVAEEMRDNDIGAVPGEEKDRLLGLVTDRDIACRALANGSDAASLTACDATASPIFSCWEDDDIKQAARYMEAHQVRRLPVINASKRRVGMLSLGDLSHRVPHTLAGAVIRAVSAHHS